MKIEQKTYLYYQILFVVDFPIVSPSMLPAASIINTLLRCKQKHGVLFKKSGAKKVTSGPEVIKLS